MDVQVENVSALRRKLTITLPKKEVRKELDKGYNKIKKEVSIKGFRKGKIPKTILEKKFKDQVQAGVVEELVQATYFDAVEQENVDPVVHPEILEHTFNDDGTLTYIAEVDTKPDFELGEYKGITVEKPIVVVSDEEVDAEIEVLRKEKAVLRTADEDHAITKDDIAVVDFQGFHEGSAMKQVHNEDFSVDIGTGRLGEEFEEKLLGLKSGEKTLYEIDFPADYPNPVLAGKKVEFKVDVKSVKERIKAELDDEFAKDINEEEYQTLDDLKNGIRERLAKGKEEAQEGDISDRLMHKIVEAHEFDLPERLVRFEIEEMIKQTEANLEKSGLSLESAGINRDDLIERNRPVAEKRVKGDFILKKIAEAAEIKVEDEDIERGYKRIADQYNMSIPEVKQYFQRREELMPFINELLNEKILTFLRQEAKLVEVEADAAAPEKVTAEEADSVDSSAAEAVAGESAETEVDDSEEAQKSTE